MFGCTDPVFSRKLCQELITATSIRPRKSLANVEPVRLAAFLLICSLEDVGYGSITHSCWSPPSRLQYCRPWPLMG